MDCHSTSKPKPDIHARLAEHMTAGQHLRRVYRDLPVESRDALRTLQAEGGRVTYDQFARDFGAIRPYRPWVANAPRQTWKCAESVAEKLWYLAFIERQGDHVILCEAVRPLLPALPIVHPVTRALASDVAAPTPDMLLLDMAMFLGMLTRERVKLMHGRQLAPRVFRMINAHLQQPEPGVDLARSERQIGRVRWLHYLAVCAGLTEVVNGTLKPSFAAWQWLDAAPDMRWQQLYAAIRVDLARRVSLSSPPSWWSTYCLPPVSLSTWDALISHLDALPVGEVYSTRTFLRKLRIACPGVIAEDVRALLAGPLSWLGAVVTGADGKQFALTLNPSSGVPGEGLPDRSRLAAIGLVPTNARSSVDTVLHVKG